VNVFGKFAVEFGITVTVISVTVVKFTITCIFVDKCC